ncbi:Peptidoglycan/LPS O-acetylase OafA/YrhL, contains acyltransferase and SGNH-hydrolase domains [Nonomuraea solani]|uniref:Peptidoglycan/LPS O-acetylase OafA/YrhL, contains acyltransferase and SGNH-hydrolase domains n=1 Tax=Nonomuraea solani TaxID=1144553 RepID=A0A1H6BWS0_9ACTN|nr:acyltransferase [Nonomuraea solani]SEG65130.1 Peptidoglycan/LPS O-acetylase OafA/YrhL, contains acyltransferase and SGNH-hydrolase domains [Nonomuraea solani]
MRSRDAALDGIRAFAALGVWLLHVGSNTGVMYREGMFAWMMSRLGIAVPIFFLLSGLLLYRPWARAVIDNTPRPKPLRYLWRRVLRVMPVYWLVTGLALWAWSSFDWLGWVKWMLLLQNFFQGDPVPDGLYQMWTLPIEMSFYVVLPLLAWLLHRFARRGNRPVRLLVGIGVLPVISIGTVAAARVFEVPQLALLLPYHLVYFACGMAMAVLSVWIGHSRVIDSLAPQLLVLAALLYAALSTGLAGPRTLTLPTISQSLWRVTLEAAVAVLLVAPFALASRPDSLRNRVLGNPVAAYLGRISYSFFLWHAPVITLQLKLTGAPPFAGDFTSVAVVSFLATLLLSVGSYHLVEVPALRLGRHRSAPSLPPTPAAPRPVAPAP